MLQQEAGSLARLVLEVAGDPVPYFGTIPQDFEVPSVYFPPPEITDQSDTLYSYALEYVWFLKVFHYADYDAHQLAVAVQSYILGNRRAVPLFTKEGEDTGRIFRVKEVAVKQLDGHGVSQITLTWICRRAYAEQERANAREIGIKVYTKQVLDAIKAEIAGNREGV